MRMRGLFFPQQDCIVDVCLVDLDATSYIGRDPESVLMLKENWKRGIYRADCDLRRWDFAAAVASVDGALAPQFEAMLRRVVERMIKNDRHASKSHIARLIRARLQLAILRAASVSLRMARQREEYHGRVGEDVEPLWDGAAVAAADAPRDEVIQ